MKKNSFINGAFIATFAIIIVKIIGVLYLIPFYAIVGEEGGALYGYAYNIYMIFLGVSSAGLPFAVSKLMSEYEALGYNSTKKRALKIIFKFISIISAVAFLILFIFAPSFAQLIVGSNVTSSYLKDVVFVIRMVSFALLIIPYLSITKGFLQGHKFITPGSISQIIEQIVRVIIILVGSFLIVKVFKFHINLAIGVSAFAAFIGGLVAYIYLYIIMKKNKKKIFTSEKVLKEEKVITNKIIIKKIITYSIPFIITGVAFSIYNFTDMVLVRRTLTDILGYSLTKADTITAVYSTWASKLLAIVIAISTGLTTSLLPNIVQSYTKKDVDDVNNKVNKSIQILLLLIVPITIFVSMTSLSIWTMFYGSSEYGGILLRVYIFTALATAISTLANNILQGLSKYKVVYIVTLSGLLLNIVMDIPLILLFDKLNLFPVWGASISTIISMSLAGITSFIYLKKNVNLNYRSTIRMIPSILISYIVFIGIILILSMFIPLNLNNRLIQIPILIIYGVISFGLYFFINYKNKNIEKVLGKKGLLNIIKRKK